jgi:hypothetical protein
MVDVEERLLFLAFFSSLKDEKRGLVTAGCPPTATRTRQTQPFISIRRRLIDG